MPRRPKDPADEFSFADLAIASCTTKRSVQLLADLGLLPGDRSIRDLKRMCVIGAFGLSGAPLLVAGRVAEKLLWSFNQADGEMASKLPEISLALADAPSARPEDREPSDYWYHRDLFHRRDVYHPGEAFRGDAYIEIADREHVYLSTKTGVPLFDAIAPEFPETSYEGTIEGWSRGTEPRFHSLAEVAEAERANVTAPALAARRSPVGLLTINASLAIRNGLDRLAEHRAHGAA